MYLWLFPCLVHVSRMAKLFVVVGTYNCSVMCFCTNAIAIKLQPKFLYSGHSGSVRAVASLGKWVASGSSDETIKLYDMEQFTETGSLMKHAGSILCLLFHSGRLFSGSEDGSIAVWQSGTWHCQQVLSGHKGPVYSISVHPSGRVALSVGRDRVLRTWNLATGYATFRQKLPEVASLVQWSPIGDMYALAFRKTITVYGVESGIRTASIHVEKNINTFQFIKNDVIAVGSDLSAIQLFDIPNGECVSRLEGHTMRVKSLALAASSGLLFSASSDGSVRVWRVSNPLVEVVCVGVYQTDSRLNCIAVVSEDTETHSTAAHTSRQQKRLTIAGAGKDAFRRESADKAEQSVALWRRKRIQRRKKMLFLSNIQHRLQRHRSRWNLPLRSMSSRKRRLARKTYILSKSQNKDSKRTL